MCWCWRTFKSTRITLGRNHPDTLLAWDRFVAINETLLRFSIQSQESYEAEITAQISVNPKLFHSYLKHRKEGRPKIGPIRLRSTYELTDDPYSMAQCFVDSFAQVFNTDSLNSRLPHQSCSSIMVDITITPAHVISAIESLNINSAVGEDGIHSRLLYALRDVLSVPLTIIYKTSLVTGILPAEWLSSVVIPMFKKSNRYDPLNYRPVSLTSMPCKVMEKMIATHLMEFLNGENLFSPHQYGFRSNHSTVDQLICTYSDIVKMVDQGKIVDLVFFDYAKAFDSVPHNVLLEKLQMIGIQGSMLQWIRRFLTGRLMRVKVSGVLSRAVPVTSGVPQGSVLGPILFLIFVNYVTSNVTCDYKIFADDIKLYVSNDLAGDWNGNRYNCLQSSIDSLVECSLSWGLKMNSGKCVVMRFCSRSYGQIFSGVSPYKVLDTNIGFVSIYSDLGVTIDRDLQFHVHVSRKVGTASNLTNNLLSCTLSRSSDFLMNVYRLHLRPLLEYASPIWNTGYLGDMRKLESIQRRWTRSVAGFESLPYGRRLHRLKLFSFQGRMLRTDLILVYKIFHGLCSIDSNDIFELASTNITRGHPFKIFKPRAQSEIMRRFFSNRVVDSWNSLSYCTVTTASVDGFKAGLLRDLNCKLYEFA